VTVRLSLPARLDSAAALSLAEELRAHQASDVVVDAEGVTLFGARGAQTLLVAARAWRRTGRSLSLTNLSPEVRGQLADLGLSSSVLLEGARS
jgi:anti-anti-sigma regulatory factor